MTGNCQNKLETPEINTWYHSEGFSLLYNNVSRNLTSSVDFCGNYDSERFSVNSFGELDGFIKFLDRSGFINYQETDDTVKIWSGIELVDNIFRTDTGKPVFQLYSDQKISSNGVFDLKIKNLGNSIVNSHQMATTLCIKRETELPNSLNFRNVVFYNTSEETIEEINKKIAFIPLIPSQHSLSPPEMAGICAEFDSQMINSISQINTTDLKTYFQYFCKYESKCGLSEKHIQLGFGLNGDAWSSENNFNVSDADRERQHFNFASLTNQNNAEISLEHYSQNTPSSSSFRGFLCVQTIGCDLPGLASFDGYDETNGFSFKDSTSYSFNNGVKKITFLYQKPGGCTKEIRNNWPKKIIDAWKTLPDGTLFLYLGKPDQYDIDPNLNKYYIEMVQSLPEIKNLDQCDPRGGNMLLYGRKHVDNKICVGPASQSPFFCDSSSNSTKISEHAAKSNFYTVTTVSDTETCLNNDDSVNLDTLEIFSRVIEVGANYLYIQESTTNTNFTSPTCALQIFDMDGRMVYSVTKADFQDLFTIVLEKWQDYMDLLPRKHIFLVGKTKGLSGLNSREKALFEHFLSRFIVQNRSDGYVNLFQQTFAYSNESTYSRKFDLGSDDHFLVSLRTEVSDVENSVFECSPVYSNFQTADVSDSESVFTFRPDFGYSMSYYLNHETTLVQESGCKNSNAFENPAKIGNLTLFYDGELVDYQTGLSKCKQLNMLPIHFKNAREFTSFINFVSEIKINWSDYETLKIWNPVKTEVLNEFINIHKLQTFEGLSNQNDAKNRSAVIPGVIFSETSTFHEISFFNTELTQIGVKYVESTITDTATTVCVERGVGDDDLIDWLDSVVSVNSEFMVTPVQASENCAGEACVKELAQFCGEFGGYLKSDGPEFTGSGVCDDCDDFDYVFGNYETRDSANEIVGIPTDGVFESNFVSLTKLDLAAANSGQILEKQGSKFVTCVRTKHTCPHPDFFDLKSITGTRLDFNTKIGNINSTVEVDTFDQTYAFDNNPHDFHLVSQKVGGYNCLEIEHFETLVGMTERLSSLSNFTVFLAIQKFDDAVDFNEYQDKLFPKIAKNVPNATNCQSELKNSGYSIKDRFIIMGRTEFDENTCTPDKISFCVKIDKSETKIVDLEPHLLVDFNSSSKCEIEMVTTTVQITTIEETTSDTQTTTAEMVTSPEITTVVVDLTTIPVTLYSTVEGSGTTPVTDIFTTVGFYGETTGVGVTTPLGETTQETTQSLVTTGEGKLSLSRKNAKNNVFRGCFYFCETVFIFKTCFSIEPEILRQFVYN